VSGDEGASMRLNDYQAEARKTDRAGDKTLAFPLLGLFGEVGTLLSVVKKKQRDAASYRGYRRLTAAMIDAIDANSPLVLTSVRAAEAFNRADAILELDMLSEVDRHRMFVAGFRRIKPDPGQLGATFEQMLEQDRTVVDDALRIQWRKRSNDVLTPNGQQFSRIRLTKITRS
jgi:hypothetical protein